MTQERGTALDAGEREFRDRARVEFIRLGVHYYASGRFAALNWIFPVAGNLLHHAVEMLLKGALVRTLGLAPLYRIGHDLDRLWSEFKRQFPAADTAQFDGPISELHQFERLRYPDKVIREGSEATLALFRDQRVVAEGSPDSVPKYSLVLEDVDALAKYVFERAGVNPQFYLPMIRDEAKAYLMRENRHPLEKAS